LLNNIVLPTPLEFALTVKVVHLLYSSRRPLNCSANKNYGEGV